MEEGFFFPVWRLVTSLEPQGSVLSPAIFILYSHNLNAIVGRMVSKFTDIIKIGGTMNTEGFLRLQRDLDQLGQQADEWQMNSSSD